MQSGANCCKDKKQENIQNSEKKLGLKAIETSTWIIYEVSQ